MPEAQIVTRKVSGGQTGGAYPLVEVEVGSGGGDGPHVQHREYECFYVLEGEFEFVIEGAGIKAGPGSLIYVPKGDLQAFENAGHTTGRMLVSRTPGGAYESFVEEVGKPVTAETGAPATEKPPNLERLAAVRAKYGVEIVASVP